MMANSAASGERGSWGSSLGFILAAAGGAVGLGNIWGFPYTAAQSGGAAFVLLYLVCVLFVAMPVMFAELSIGRATNSSPVTAFKKLAPKSLWWLVGGQGVLTGFAILAFYSVVAAWAIGYLAKAIMGEFTAGMTADESEAVFTGLIGNAGIVLLWTTAFFVLGIIVVQGGIHGGIERACSILMPIFFLLMIGLAIRSMTLDGAGEGLRFLFNADVSKINQQTVLSALSQAFFSMSLGMGAMLTYGSYLSKKQNLPWAGFSIGMADTGVAILSGLMIFPAFFAMGAELGAYKEEGLVFIVLPTIFNQLPAGQIFAIAFYSLLVIAALTSSISLLEVITSYFIDEWGVNRKVAVWTFGGVCYLISVPCALGWQIWDGMSFMGLLILIFFQYSLLVGGLFIAIFVGWAWTPKAAIAEMTAGGKRFPALGLWSFLIRWVCPVVIALIIGNQLYGAFASVPADDQPPATTQAADELAAPPPSNETPAP